MTDPAMWSRARSVAKCIVSDWMLLDETERTMDRLVAEIEGELDKAFDDGMKAVAGFSQPLIRAADVKLIEENVADLVAMTRAAALEEAADIADGEDCPHCAAAIRAIKEQP